MKGKLYTISKNELEILSSEQIKLIVNTEGNRTVVEGNKIRTGSILTKSISAESIIAEHISTDAIKTGHLSAASITTIKIAAEAVDADKIKANSILAKHITADAIEAKHIQAEAIEAKHIVSEAIQAGHISAEAIEAKHIKALTIEGKHIKAETISVDKLVAGSILLPDTSYGGVYITNEGMIIENHKNKIELSSNKGIKVTNSDRDENIFYINPNTGELEINASKISIASSNVYTEDNLKVGGTNIIRDSGFEENFKHYPIVNNGFSVDTEKKFLGQNTLYYQATPTTTGYPAVVTDYIEVRDSGFIGAEMVLSVYAFIPNDAILSNDAYVEVCGYSEIGQTTNNFAGVGSRVDIPRDTPKDTWTRFLVKFTIQEFNGTGQINYIKVLLRHRANNTTPNDKFWYALPKLEVGNVVTPWTKHQEDNMSEGKTTAAIQLATDNISFSVKSAEETSKMSGGKILFPDTEFGEGFNGMYHYNNSAGTAVSLERESRNNTWDNPSESPYRVKVIHKSGAKSPELGGFRVSVVSRANAKFIQVFIAKLPVGYEFLNMRNSIGKDGTQTWLTDNKGTGKWTEYKLLTEAGEVKDGSLDFSNFGHMAVKGSPEPTDANPLIWYINSSTVYDITSDRDIASKSETEANITLAKESISLEVDKKIESLSIGGLNIFRNSNFEEDFKYWTRNGFGYTINKDERLYGEPVLDYQWNSSGGAYPSVMTEYISTKEYDLTGREMTFSVYFYLPLDAVLTRMPYVQVCGYEFQSASNNLSWTNSSIDIPLNTKKGEWIRLQTTFTVPESNNNGPINYVRGVFGFRATSPNITDKFKYALPQLEFGNMISSWSKHPKDNASQSEMSAAIQIASDSIELGVNTSITNIKTGTSNQIMNSSCDNEDPYILINSVPHGQLTNATNEYIESGWTRMIGNNNTSPQMYSIGSSAKSVAMVGLENYNFDDWNVGDEIIFSAEIMNETGDNNVSVSILKGFDRDVNTWVTITSDKVTRGQQKRVYCKTTIEKDQKGFLFRINGGSLANSKIKYRKVMLTKGSHQAEWSPNIKDNYKNSYNENLFLNSNFIERFSAEESITNKHDNLYALNWPAYNSDYLNNPKNVFHAHIDMERFGFPVYSFNELDGTRNWKAINQIIDESSLSVTKNGAKAWVSLDLYNQGKEIGNTQIFGGFRYYDKAGERAFHDGYFKIYPNILGEWERCVTQVKINYENVDTKREIAFYFYGYNWNVNNILYIKNLKLEIGKYSTPYDVSTKDIVKVSEMTEVKLKLEPESISQSVTSSEHFTGWSEETMATKADDELFQKAKADLEELGVVINDETEGIVTKVGLLETRAGSVEITIENTLTTVTDQGETISSIRDYMTFDDKGLTISKSNSPFRVNLNNESLSFLDGDIEVAYINNQKLYITEAEVIDNIIVGSHSIAKDPSTGKTVIRWVSD